MRYKCASEYQSLLKRKSDLFRSKTWQKEDLICSTFCLFDSIFWQKRTSSINVKYFWVGMTDKNTMWDYGHKMAKSPIAILCGPNSNPNSNPKKRLGFGYEGLVFCRNNSWLMENMGKWLTVPKCVLINQPKIPQTPKKFSAKIACPSPRVWDFDEKASLGVRSPCLLESVQDLYFKSWAS